MDWWILVCSFVLGAATFALYYVVDRLQDPS